MAKADRVRGDDPARLTPEDPSLHRLEAWPKFAGCVALGAAAIVALLWHRFHSPLGGLAVWTTSVALLPAYGLLAWSKLPNTNTSAKSLRWSGSEAVGEIRKEFTRWDEAAKNWRDRRRLNAIGSAALAPCAVFLLSIQIVAVQDPGIKIAFVAGELLIVLVSIRTTMGLFIPTHLSWIEARSRAELLRREHFLLETRSGPYFGADDTDLAETVAERVKQISNGDPANPKLIRVRVPDFNDHRAAPDPKWLESTMDEYQRDRISYQRDTFYLPKYRRHRYFDVAYEGLAILSIYVAASMATLHLGLLFNTHRPELLEQLIDIAAIVLPPLGACFMALRASFENQRLRRTYAFHALQLNHLDQELRDMVEKLKTCADGTDLTGHAYRFGHLVLEVEGVLATELTSWRLILEPENPAG